MLCCAMFLGSCSHDDQPGPDDVDVYMAGLVFNNSNGYTKAVYWKNNEPVYLTDGSTRELARAIAVSGNDVYVAGTEFTEQRITQAKYWKNGVPVILTDGTKQAGVNSITVAGGDVYVTGYEEAAPKSPFRIAKYWKNGVAVDLTDGKSYAIARDLVVSGNDIYVVGTENINPSLHRVYWKNGKQVRITSTEGAYVIDFESVGMAVQGSDVFIAAGERPDSTAKFSGKYWKNGAVTTLTDGTTNVFPNSIAVSGNNVFVCGWYDVNPDTYSYKFAYWKNGQMTILPSTSTTYRANRLAVSGEDAYVVGSANELHGCCWKNGVQVFLTPDQGEIHDIKIVQR